MEQEEYNDRYTSGKYTQFQHEPINTIKHILDNSAPSGIFNQMIQDVTISTNLSKDDLREIGKLKPYYRYCQPNDTINIKLPTDPIITHSYDITPSGLVSSTDPHNDEVKEHNPNDFMELLTKVHRRDPEAEKAFRDAISDFVKAVDNNIYRIISQHENSNNGTQAEQTRERLSIDGEADGLDKSGNK